MVADYNLMLCENGQYALTSHERPPPSAKLACAAKRPGFRTSREPRSDADPLDVSGSPPRTHLLLRARTVSNRPDPKMRALPATPAQAPARFASAANSPQSEPATMPKVIQAAPASAFLRRTRSAEYRAAAVSAIPRKIQRVTRRETPGARRSSSIVIPRAPASRTTARGMETAKSPPAVRPSSPSTSRVRGSVRTGNGTVFLPYKRRAVWRTGSAPPSVSTPARGKYVISLQDLHRDQYGVTATKPVEPQERHLVVAGDVPSIPDPGSPERQVGEKLWRS